MKSLAGCNFLYLISHTSVILSLPPFSIRWWKYRVITTSIWTIQRRWLRWCLTSYRLKCCLSQTAPQMKRAQGYRRIQPRINFALCTTLTSTTYWKSWIFTEMFTLLLACKTKPADLLLQLLRVWSKMCILATIIVVHFQIVCKILKCIGHVEIVWFLSFIFHENKQFSQPVTDISVSVYQVLFNGKVWASMW